MGLFDDLNLPPSAPTNRLSAFVEALRALPPAPGLGNVFASPSLGPPDALRSRALLNALPPPAIPSPVDTYLRQVLAQYSVSNDAFSPARQVQATLMPVIQAWANRFLLDVSPSGSFAKGTAVRTGTDIDLFISLSPDTAETLEQIYNSLFQAVGEARYQPKRQNVSIGVRVGSHDVDLVPAKRQSMQGFDHSLYSNRTGTWLQTNVNKHIATVQASNRLDEIRLLKIWRNRIGLDFPSFYLELAAIRALQGKWSTNLSGNIVAALEFMRDNIKTARFMDPANTNNLISDSVTVQGKQAIATAATNALASTWNVVFA